MWYSMPLSATVNIIVVSDSPDVLNANPANPTSGVPRDTALESCSSVLKPTIVGDQTVHYVGFVSGHNLAKYDVIAASKTHLTLHIEELCKGIYANPSEWSGVRIYLGPAWNMVGWQPFRASIEDFLATVANATVIGATVNAV